MTFGQLNSTIDPANTNQTVNQAVVTTPATFAACGAPGPAPPPFNMATQ
jgi:hypothetical protein